MDKQQLEQIFSREYQPALWREILTDVFGVTNLYKTPKPITLNANELAESAFELGSFDTADDRIIGLYQINLNHKPQIERNKVGLRELLRSIYKYDVDGALVVFVQGDKWRFSYISEIRTIDDDGNIIEQATETKRYTYLFGEGESCRTAAERFELLRGANISLLDIAEAFSVEKLTDEFFKEYKTVFNEIVHEIESSIPDDKNPEEGLEMRILFTQRLLNRLMFIYFIQKKGWLKFENEENYLRALFNKAISNNENFYSDRLHFVFFWGLNNPSDTTETTDNIDLIERRGDVPPLNGGLFQMESDGYDISGKVSISNERFEDILSLFERYNFTIDESTPNDIEVAVDPEMLGRVFEELVTGRSKSGSFYTPRLVVSFMCRESLKYYLAPFDKTETIAKFVDNGNGEDLQSPEEILEALRKICVCDPACGSGAYLLGMMQELLHLRESLFSSKNLGDASLYKRKREIIENNLFGVDKDTFAVQIASLRLWLSLAIESEKPRPLPNLKYKIGCGDSLLSPVDDSQTQQDLHRRALIEQFRARKSEYAKEFHYQKKQEIEAEIDRLRIELAQMFNHLPDPPKPQQITLAESNVQPLKEKIKRVMNADAHDSKPQAEKFQKELNNLNKQIQEWKSQLNIKVYDSGDVFDWSVEFAEIFAEGGFDIVLANPPYVRQEEIDKKAKPKLLKLYAETMSGKSDLYVAFYQRALEILKTNGVHVFVCSNSWLDVGYGGKLQNYLLENAQVLAIYDSAVERQFATADVNTIISFINKKESQPTDETKFVSLQAPFNEAIVDEEKRRTVIKTNKEILTAGRNEKNVYKGDKWGGKYLRAPDIYFTILEKGKDKLVRLGDIADVRRGITTGANEFFYLNDEDQERWQVEDEFLRPVIKSPRECRSIVVNPDDLKFKLFYCHKDKSELQGTNALRYIEWGETDEEWINPKTEEPNPPYLRPSCRGRRNWYDVGTQIPPEFLWFKAFNDRFLVLSNVDKFAVSDRFYCITLNEDHQSESAKMNISLNSSVCHLFTELNGRVNLGAGALDNMTYETANIIVLSPKVFSINGFSQITRSVFPAAQEIQQPDRQELDNIIFDALDLTKGEREAVYEAVIDLVSKRLNKAKTISK